MSMECDWCGKSIQPIQDWHYDKDNLWQKEYDRLCSLKRMKAVSVKERIIAFFWEPPVIRPFGNFVFHAGTCYTNWKRELLKKNKLIAEALR